MARNHVSGDDAEDSRTARRRVALVTGAGRGIGEAIARALDEAESIVVVTDKAKSRAEKVATSLSAQAVSWMSLTRRNGSMS